MRRPPHYLFTLCSSVSAVVWMILAFLWVHGHLPASDYEERRLAAWMWIPFTASGILPLIWGARAVVNWRRHRRSHPPRGFQMMTMPSHPAAATTDPHEFN